MGNEKLQNLTKNTVMLGDEGSVGGFKDSRNVFGTKPIYKTKK